MTLNWTRDAHGFIAPCGSEGQGEARVLPFGAGWRWMVDMLPFDQEPAIRGLILHARAIDAQREAADQVDAWPSVIAGAHRVL